MDELLTVKDVAGLLRVSRKTVYDLFYKGELESIQIGRARRVTREALERFLDEHTDRREVAKDDDTH